MPNRDTTELRQSRNKEQHTETTMDVSDSATSVGTAEPSPTSRAGSPEAGERAVSPFAAAAAIAIARGPSEDTDLASLSKALAWPLPDHWPKTSLRSGTVLCCLASASRQEVAKAEAAEAASWRHIAPDKATPNPKKKRKGNATADADRGCHCKDPLAVDKFMLCCDTCERWYHGECCGITERQAEKIGVWRCR